MKIHVVFQPSPGFFVDKKTPHERRSKCYNCINPTCDKKNIKGPSTTWDFGQNNFCGTHVNECFKTPKAVSHTQKVLNTYNSKISHFKIYILNHSSF